jgi:hypothetical protein
MDGIKSVLDQVAGDVRISTADFISTATGRVRRSSRGGSLPIAVLIRAFLPHITCNLI